jgi:hypothetical protein
MGKGTKTIGINMKYSMARELERRASGLGISTGAYCKIVICRHLDSDAKLMLSDSSREAQTFSAGSPSSRDNGNILQLTKSELCDVKTRGLHSISNDPDANTLVEQGVTSNTTKTLRSKTEDEFQESSVAKLEWWILPLFLILVLLVFFYLGI